MRMRKLLVVVLVVSLFVVSQVILTANKENIVWKINISVSPTHSYGIAVQEWASLVTDATNGKMQFQIFYFDALGPQKETLEQMRLGIVQGCYALEPLSFWVPEVDLFGAGYLFKDEAHLVRAVEGKVGEMLKQSMIKSGFRPIIDIVSSPRMITSNRPINNLSDLRGMKIRVPQAPGSIKLFQALGAKPIALPFTDVIPGLQSGVIDGQENPLDVVWDYKMWEVQRYVAMTAHQRQLMFVVVSERDYQKLPADFKKIIQDAAEVAQDNLNKRLRLQEQEIIARLQDKGMIFTYPDQTEFRKAAATTYRELNPKVQELIQIVQTME